MIILTLNNDQHTAHNFTVKYFPGWKSETFVVYTEVTDGSQKEGKNPFQISMMLIKKKGGCDCKGKREKTGFWSQATDRFIRNSCDFAHCFTPLLYDVPSVLINAYTLRESMRHLLRAVEGTGSVLQIAYAKGAISFPCGSTPHELNSQTAALSPLHWSLSVISLMLLVLTEAVSND